MYHSINLGGKNTYDDWKIVPASRPVFNPPSVKTRYVDIPGADGSIDLTESLTGYPVYNNREGSLEFIVLNGYRPWYETYSMIADHLHGRKMQAVLEDEPSFYYEGRFAVNEWKSEKDWSRITIDYNLNPYKRRLANSLGDWEWDPFNFYNGVISPTIWKNINVPSDHPISISARSYEGPAPICPKFIVSTMSGNGIMVTFMHKLLGQYIERYLPDGVTQIPEIVITEDPMEFSFQGVDSSGTVSVLFRFGRL